MHEAGKKPVTVLVFPTQNAANLAISSGRAGSRHGRLAGRRLPGQAVRTAQFKLVGKTYGVAPYGLAFPKSSGMASPSWRR